VAGYFRDSSRSEAGSPTQVNGAVRKLYRSSHQHLLADHWLVAPTLLAPSCAIPSASAALDERRDKRMMPESPI
jgi:hypothetical protein